MSLSVGDLLLGGSLTHTVEIPAHVLAPAGGGAPATVQLRPLRLVDVHRIQKAAQESQALTSVLMVQQALVEPKATIDEVNRMHAGLVEFLLREVNRISGLTMNGDEIQSVVQAPLARACFVLSRELGWTPDECAGLTLGQILLYVEMIGRGQRVERGAT
ncbi:MAG TPA: hypothetical protein VKB80_35510 [Kofleriaceae bacterium]|nr:hypothetical protein [Kofleriaceae bacterium]